METGDRYEGRGQWKGWLFVIESVVPENDVYSGRVTFMTIKQPPCLLASVQGSLDYYRGLGWTEYVANMEAACTQPRREYREPKWFENWLKAGHIAKVGE